MYTKHISAAGGLLALLFTSLNFKEAYENNVDIEGDDLYIYYGLYASHQHRVFTRISWGKRELIKQPFSNELKLFMGLAVANRKEIIRAKRQPNDCYIVVSIDDESAETISLRLIFITAESGNELQRWREEIPRTELNSHSIRAFILALYEKKEESSKVKTPSLMNLIVPSIWSSNGQPIAANSTYRPRITA
ncbi:hypothetical protein KBC03_01845 [Patescibacteria group bacterium]|nr:hypothetical protein [Patescibacteria group bacterium]